MKTKQALALQNITDLVTVLMCGPKQFDMATIEPCIVITMQETGLQFQELPVIENWDIVASKFDTTEEYFFDRINTMNITEAEIKSLVELCIA